MQVRMVNCVLVERPTYTDNVAMSARTVVVDPKDS